MAVEWWAKQGTKTRVGDSQLIMQTNSSSTSCLWQCLWRCCGFLLDQRLQQTSHGMGDSHWMEVYHGSNYKYLWRDLCMVWASSNFQVHLKTTCPTGQGAKSSKYHNLIVYENFLLASGWTKWCRYSAHCVCCVYHFRQDRDEKLKESLDPLKDMRRHFEKRHKHKHKDTEVRVSADSEQDLHRLWKTGESWNWK